MSVVGGNSIANVASVTPGRRRRQPGVQRRLAARRHRPDDRDRLLGRRSSCSRPPGTSCSRSCCWSGRSAGRAARSSSSESYGEREGEGGRAVRRPQGQEGSEEGGRGRVRVAEYGALPGWQPERPRFRLGGFLVSWLLLTVSLLVAAALVPHVSIPDFRDALVVAIVVGALTAVLPPLVAALRLPLHADRRLPARARGRRPDPGRRLAHRLRGDPHRGLRLGARDGARHLAPSPSCSRRSSA